MVLHPYCSGTGRNLIYEYLDSLPVDEQVDGYTVLQYMEKGEFDKIFFKPWERSLYEGSENMPFIQTNIEKEIEKRKENNPEFRKAWDESRAEYKLIGEIVSLRKQEKITQKELAALTGNKQQVISRIERRESIPTIKVFSHILNALGYELQIVKKKSI